DANKGLYRGDYKHEPQSTFRNEVEVIDDETVHTSTIREDAEWSNGDTVTSNDFENAWKRTIEEVGHYAYVFVKSSKENEQELLGEDKDPEERRVEAEDDHTLVVTLENPNPLLEQLLTFPTFFPLNEDFVEEQGEEYGTEADKILSNGAFILDSWEHDKGWT